MPAKKKEKQICSKCGQYIYCDNHHLVPKSIKPDGETRPLCKNCHDDFHRFLGFKFLRKANAQPEEFYLRKYALWLTYSVVAGLFGMLVYFVF